MRSYIRRMGLCSLLACSIACQAAAAPAGPECVVLLHGLGRTKRSLSKLERYLTQQGFAVVNTGYPSRHKPIQALSLEAIPRAVDKCLALNARRIHFVTHSMGGILVRYYFKDHEVPRLGRVVMLSPPNSGSEVVDRLKDTRLFQWVYGPAGCQLGTGAGSLPKTLGAPRYPVGVITGDRSIDPLLSLMIPGPDDGKVSVASARLPGMRDFIVVHRTHPFIMNDKTVHRQVLHFIREGAFRKAEERLPGRRVPPGPAPL